MHLKAVVALPETNNIADKTEWLGSMINFRIQATGLFSRDRIAVVHFRGYINLYSWCEQKGARFGAEGI